jgi:uncharacterized membrane protein YfhO
MKFSSSISTTIDTYIKYDPNWRVTVNGTQVDTQKNGLFLSFHVDRGDHIVRIYYYPKPLIYGLIIGALASIVLLALYFVFKKPLYGWLLEVK